MPRPSKSPKHFWAGPNFLSQSQIFCATQKEDFYSANLVSVPTLKVFDKALNAINFLNWIKKFGPSQIILGPVEGQVISIFFEVQIS